MMDFLDLGYAIMDLGLGDDLEVEGVGSGSVCGVLGIGEEDAEVVVGVDTLG